MPEGKKESGEKKERINNTQAGLMIGVAFLFDLISAIPAVGQIIADVGTFIVFLIWFLILGLPLLSPKKITVYVVATVVSAIPFLSILPEITLAIVAFIIFTRTEDALGIQVLSSKGINPAALEKVKGGLKPQFNQLQQGVPKVGQVLDKGPAVKEKQERQRRPMDDMLPSNTAEGYAT